MSFLVQSPTCYAFRNNGTIDTAHVSLCAWIRMDASSVNQGQIITIGDGTTPTNSLGIYTAADGSAAVEVATRIGGTQSQSMPAIALGTWHHVAFVRNGTAIHPYLDGVPGTVLTCTASTFTSVALYIGLGGAVGYFQGAIGLARLWTAVLSDADIAAEYASATAVRAANLAGSYPLVTDTTDASGNGADATNVGITTWLADPAVGPGIYGAGLYGAGLYGVSGSTFAATVRAVTVSASGTVAGNLVGSGTPSVRTVTTVGVANQLFPGAAALSIQGPATTGTAQTDASMAVSRPTLAAIGAVQGGIMAAPVRQVTAAIVATNSFPSGVSIFAIGKPSASGSGSVVFPIQTIPINRPTAFGSGSVSAPITPPPTSPVITVFTWIDPNQVEHQLSGLPDLEIVQGRVGLHHPPVKISEDALPGPSHGGARLRESVYDSREIDLPMMLICRDYGVLWDRHTEISSWFRLQRDSSGRPLPGRLRVRRPDGSEREITCIYSSGLGGTEAFGESGPTFRKLMIVLRASDPLWYSRNPTVLTFSIVAGATFFSAPFLPLHLGASSVSTGATVNNPGDETSWPIWQIVGPGNNPVLTNNTTGQSLALTLTLTAGQSVTIDTRPTAKLITNDQTSANLYSALAPGSATMWPLQPGSNSISVAMGAATAASRLNLNFIPCFLGA